MDGPFGISILLAPPLRSGFDTWEEETKRSKRTGEHCSREEPNELGHGIP